MVQVTASAENTAAADSTLRNTTGSAKAIEVVDTAAAANEMEAANKIEDVHTGQQLHTRRQLLAIWKIRTQTGSCKHNVG